MSGALFLMGGIYFAHAGVEAAVLSGERAANNLASAYDA